MIARSRYAALRSLIAGVICSLLASSPAQAAAQEGYATGPEGHSFRVRFDPESRIRLGIAEAIGVGGADGGAVAQAPEVTAGISYRQIEASGAGKDRVVWQIDHRFISGWLHPFRGAAREIPAFDATVYSVTVLRHDLLPSIVFPSSPPVSIAFPFDAGFAAKVGAVSVPERFPVARLDGALNPLLHVGVMHAAMILDPWRSGELGRSLEFALGARYDIDAYGAPSLRAARVLHRIAPMTAAELRFRTQSDDGLLLVDCRGEVVPHWTSEGIWRVAAAGSARLERILVAINDAPIALVMEGDYRLSPATRDVGLTHELRASLGFAFNLELR